MGPDRFFNRNGRDFDSRSIKRHTKVNIKVEFWYQRMTCTHVEKENVGIIYNS